eukprot:s1324_g38.t1
MNARALPCRSLAAISSSKFVEFYICFTMHLPWLVVLPCVVSAHIRGVTSNTKFLDIQFLTEEDVDETIVLKVDSKRLANIRSGLETTYTSLPKTDGHLAQQTLRYVLHRYFLNQHGWLIKGLEPQNTSWTHQTQRIQKDWSSWLPSYVQKHFEAQMQRGTELSALAEMVAIIEDLVHKEAERQLQEIYEAMGKSAETVLDRSAALEVIDMYALVFLVARNISVADPVKNRKRLLGFRKKYHGFEEMHRWLEGLVEEHLANGDSDSGVDFGRLKEVVWEVGDRYPEFNDQECQQLKRTLMDMEGGSRKPGRIPLADFYNKSNHNHWRFTESPEYLRDLGALDETDPQRPHVLLANYLSSFNNCLRATSLYAVCCRNPCEGLLASLEREVGAPYATPDQLAALVANLSTDTMAKRSSPEKFEAKLLERLRSIGNDEGQVPLHGRLFAQWMHHAFPRECPYPHAAGTTNPQTPDEWMKAMGKSTAISEEQKQEIVAAYCPSDPEAHQASKECHAETAELPWSDREELLAVHASATATVHGATKTKEADCFGWFCLARRLVPGLAILRWHRKLAKLRHGLLLGFLSWIGIALELVDFRVVVASGLLYLLWQKASSSIVDKIETKTEKCEV